MRIVVLLIVLLTFAPVALAQSHAVFLDDTLYYRIDTRSSCCKYQFKDSLSDGNWILYDISRKDSVSIKQLNEHILLSESFNGGLRHGRSYRYRYSYGKKKRSLYLATIIDYQKGKIDGEIVQYRAAGEPVYKWSVSNNQLNGLCVTYDMEPECYGKISTISYFENDSLIRWEEYNDGKELVGKGVRLDDEHIEYFIYENNVLKYKCYYKNYYLEKYHEYLNDQVTERVHYGPFHLINMKDFIYGIIYPQYSKYEWTYMFYIVKSRQEQKPLPFVKKESHTPRQ